MGNFKLTQGNPNSGYTTPVIRKDGQKIVVEATGGNKLEGDEQGMVDLANGILTAANVKPLAAEPQAGVYTDLSGFSADYDDSTGSITVYDADGATVALFEQTPHTHQIRL